MARDAEPVDAPGVEPVHGDAAGSALARGLQLLEAFGAHDGWLGNAELARRTGFSKPTVSRLCATLVALGCLRRNPAGKLRPGLRLLALARPVLRGLLVRQRARPLLQALATRLDGSAALVMAHGLHLLPIEAARAPSLHALYPDIHLDKHLAGTAGGRALLAQLDESARAAALQGLQALADWPALQDKLMRSWQDCAAQGCCLSFDDDDALQRSLGVPLLRLADGRALALQVAVPVYRSSRARFLSEAMPPCLTLAATLRSLAQDAGLDAES